MKGLIEICPIHHHLEDRVRTHAFLCMLAYYVAFRGAPDIGAAAVQHRRRAALAGRPREALASAKAKANSARTQDGHAAHSFTDLITELGALCQNEIRIGHAEHTFARLATPTELQSRAFELLGVKPA